MPEQLVLPGFESGPPLRRPSPDAARRQVAHALFFALLPDPGTASFISACAEELRATHGLGGTPLKADRLHITLQYLGQWQELPQAAVDAAQAAGSTIAMPPFEVVLDQVLSFDKNPRRPLALRASDGAPGVTALQHRLYVALFHAGFRRFVGHPAHMTLAYRSAPLPTRVLEPMRWQACEFVLVHSHVGKGLHEPLHRWPLGV